MDHVSCRQYSKGLCKHKTSNNSEELWWMLVGGGRVKLNTKIAIKIIHTELNIWISSAFHVHGQLCQ